MPPFERSERAPRKEMEVLARRIDDLRKQVTNPYAFTKALGETLIAQTEARFDFKRGPDEVSWRPWSADYAKTRTSSDSLLIDNSTHEPGTPHLRDSFKAQIERGAVTVSTDVKYAMPNNAKRPFIGLSRQNLVELEMVMQTVLESMIERRPIRNGRRGRK